MDKTSRIFVTGHRGMVGSAFLRILPEYGFKNLIMRTRQELDLRDPILVRDFFKEERPDVVILNAAKVGGIMANMNFPADFLYDNLMIESNIFHCAKEFKIKKLIFLGSSCVYPRECPQPMKEEYLLTGPLEPTNEGYAIAKIAGLKMAEYFHRQFQLDSLVLMPSNLYGKGDSFDPAHAHVLSSLVKKFIDAVDENKEKVINWGTGVARREFTNVDDLVHAVVFLLDKWKTPQMINVGTGEDVSIRELSDLISRLTGFSGKVEWDNSKPDGMPRKCMDVSKLNSLGFKTKISLESGIKDMILEYKKSKQEGKLK